MKFKSRRLPFAYDELTYIQSTGTQYIDTGIKAIANSRVEMKFNRTAYAGLTNVSAIFGGYDSNQRNYGLAIDQTTIYWMFGGQSSAKKTFPLNTDYEVVFDATNKTFTIGDFTQSFSSLSLPAQSNGNIYLFTNSAVGSLATYDKQYWLKGRIYYFRYYEKGLLKNNLIPCIRKIDNVAGMYDLVEGKFYTNAGTGSFIAGDVVKTVDKVIIKEKTYQLLDYIQSTGKEWIDTGYKLNNNSVLEIEAQSTDATQSNNTLAGVGESGSSADRVQFHFGSAAGTVSMRIDGTLSANQTVGTNKFNGIIDIPNKKAYFNGTQIISTFSGDINTSVNFPLFRRSSVEAAGIIYSKARIYSFTIKENNALIHNFIPARRLSDNEVGMLDMVEGKFYGNVSGQGAFIGSDNRYDGYEFYDYIENNTTTAYLDLDYTSLPAKAEIYAQGSTAKNASQILITASDSNGGYWFGITGGNKWGVGTTSGTYTSIDYNTRIKATINFDKTSDNKGVISATVNDESITRAGTTVSTTYKFNLFKNVGGSSNYPFYGKIFSCKLYDSDNVLVRDLVPAKRLSDNAVGMLDIANNVFYANQGTGVFTTGNKVPAPDEYYVKKEVQELRLPYNGNKYKFFDYIESSGTQYIDTGYAFQDDFSWEIDFEGFKEQTTLFGGRTSSNRTAILYNNPPACCPIAGNNGASTPFKFADLTTGRHKVKMSVASNKGSAWLDDVQTHNNVSFSGTYISGTSQAIFADNFGTSVAEHTTAKVYNLKMWQGLVLARDFIPAQRLSDNAIGMYDKVTDTFFENKGAGSFIAGNEIKPMFPFWKRYPDVPSQYEVKEYLQSSGTQYIDTGYIANINSDVEIKFNVSSMNCGIFGSRTSASSNSFSVFVGTAGTATDYVGSDFGNYNTTRAISSNKSMDADVVVRTNKTLRQISTRSEVLASNTNVFTGTLTTPTTCKLFKLDNIWTGGTNMSGKIYYTKIWDNDILVRDFVPVRRKSDNVLGMYDIVTDTLFTNAGSGSFTAG